MLPFVYILWRAGYRLALGLKSYAAPMPKCQEVAARSVHWVLTACTLLMPLAGMAGSCFGGRSTEIFGVFTSASGPEIALIRGPAHALHGNVAWILVIVFAVHVAEAFKHHLIDRGTTLLRMLGGA